MSTVQVDSALALGFQTRRFSCDRCYRHKLRCERKPVLTSAGISLPLGPCKRCGKAGVPCTTGNAPAPQSSGAKRRQEPEKEPTPQTEGAQLDTQRNGGHILKETPSGSVAQDMSEGQSPFDMSLFNSDANLPIDDFDFNLTFADDGGGIGHIDPTPRTTSGSETLSAMLFGLNEGCESLSSHKNTDSAIETAECIVAQPVDIVRGSHSHGRGVEDEPRTSGENDVHMNAHDRLFNRISHLHTYIFSEFRYVSAEDFGSMFLGGSTSDSGRSRSSSSGEYSSMVNKVVYASETILDILNSCGKPDLRVPFAGSPPSSKQHHNNIPASKLSYSALLQNEELASRPNCRNRRTSNDNGSRQTKMMKPLGIDGPLYAGLVTPLKISLFSCYVTVLSVYRIILNKAFEALQSQASSISSPSLPPDAPEPPPTSCSSSESICTKSPLRSSNLLRIRIQLEVLTHLLERFDDSWAASRGRAKEIDGGIHSDGLDADLKLLRHMLVHEGFECEADDHGGVGPLMHLVKRIKWMLRTCSLSQASI